VFSHGQGNPVCVPISLDIGWWAPARVTKMAKFWGNPPQDFVAGAPYGDTILCGNSSPV